MLDKNWCDDTKASIDKINADMEKSNPYDCPTLAILSRGCMIYIDIKANILYLNYRYEGERKVRRRRYPVASGSEKLPSPKGKFHIVHKIMYPSKFYADLTKEEAKATGIAAMEINVKYLGRPYAIHGRHPDVALVDQHTGGCIAMLEDDLIELFNCVDKGTPVIIWDVPYTFAKFDEIPDYNRLTIWPPRKDVHGKDNESAL